MTKFRCTTLLPAVVMAAILFITIPLGADPLRLRQVTFEPGRGNPADLIPMDYLKQGGESRQDNYSLVQFRRSLSSEEQLILEQAGVIVVRYIPDHGYIVRIEGDQQLFPVMTKEVTYFDALQPYFRIDPRILTMTRVALEQGKGNEPVTLRICLFPGEDVDLVTSILSGQFPVRFIGRHRGETAEDGGLVLCSVKARDLGQTLPGLARLPGIEMILPHPRMMLNNNEGIWVHQSFVNGSTPLFNHGLTGSGQIVAVSDSGLGEDECYFYDTVSGYSPIDSTAPFTDVAPNMSKRKVILYLDMGGDGRGDADTAGPAHGTHTAGSITGDNYATPVGPSSAGHDNGDGMAPAAKLVEQDLGGSLEYLNGGGTFGEILDAAHIHGARIHSNSWGSSCCNFFLGCAFCYPYEPLTYCNVYDDFARDADLKMWQYQDMLVLVAAGNDGSCGELSIGTPATAKNILSVGATEHGATATNRAAFSGQGLCYDGRMKPTIMAQGVDVISAAGDNNLNPPSCATRTMSGTSMACPTTAGMSVLARQYYTDGFYPNGAASPGSGFTPSGALVKATVIGSGRDMTGVTGSPPNKQEGFGRVTLDDVLYFAGDATKLLVIDSYAGIKENQPFAANGFRDYAIAVNSTGQPLKVTLVWTDPPAALSASPALVNNLNLSVQTPAGEILYRDAHGLLRNTRGNEESAANSDSVNVEEQILIPAPMPTGNYIVRVQAAQINQGPQHYAVVITGDVSWRPTSEPVPALSLPILMVLSLMLVGFIRQKIQGFRLRTSGFRK